MGITAFFIHRPPNLVAQKVLDSLSSAVSSFTSKQNEGLEFISRVAFEFRICCCLLYMKSRKLSLNEQINYH